MNGMAVDGAADAAYPLSLPPPRPGMPPARETVMSATSIIGLAVLAGAIALIITLFLASRRRARPRLLYAVRGIEIVSPHIAHFGEVRLAGRPAPITSLTLSEMLVWNASGQPIDGANAAPLKVALGASSTSPAKPYDLRLGPSDATEAGIAGTPAEPALSYAALPPRGGVVVRVLHGGEPAALRLAEDEAADGKTAPLRTLPPYLPWDPRRVRFSLLILGGVLGLILMKADILHPLYVVCILVLLLLFGGGLIAAVLAPIERWRLRRLSPATRYFSDPETIAFDWPAPRPPAPTA